MKETAAVKLVRTATFNENNLVYLSLSFPSPLQFLLRTVRPKEIIIVLSVTWPK